MTGSAPYRAGIAELAVDGRPVRALVDTAGSALCLSQALADELGLGVHEWLDDQGTPVAVLDPPALRVGGEVLDTEGLVAYGFEDTRPLGLAARHADLLLPAPVLRRHHVVLDHPGNTITVGPPGSLERVGVPVPAFVDGDTGFVVATVEVEGEPFELLLDTAVCSTVADGLFRAWQGDHPGWPASGSAVGPGNVTGLHVEARVPMLRVPLVQFGPFSLPEVAFAWRGAGDVAGDGTLGANVLRLLRLDLDYSAGTVRAEQGAPFPDNDAELVGVVLALGEEGYEVAATVTGLDEVHPGDGLEAVDGAPVADLPLPDVLDLLRGTPGDRHVLRLRRDGETLEVHAPVLRLL